MPTLLLATRSNDKVREIRQILASVFRGSIITLHEAGITHSPAEDDVEAFDSFLDNAHAKAAFFLQQSGLPTIADDSGISVDALGGDPGVRSRRYAAAPGLDGADLDLANNHRLLHELRDTPDHLRTARYTCAAVLHMPAPGGHSRAGLGTCSGSILRQPRGSHGFGYDPIFLDPETGLSFAELDPVEKNRRSHRARAFRTLAANFPALS